MLGLLARAGALQYKHMGLFQPARAPVLGYKDTSLTDINTAPHTLGPVKHSRHSLHTGPREFQQNNCYNPEA